MELADAHVERPLLVRLPDVDVADDAQELLPLVPVLLAEVEASEEVAVAVGIGKASADDVLLQPEPKRQLKADTPVLAIEVDTEREREEIVVADLAEQAFAAERVGRKIRFLRIRRRHRLIARELGERRAVDEPRQ